MSLTSFILLSFSIASKPLIFFCTPDEQNEKITVKIQRTPIIRASYQVDTTPIRKIVKPATSGAKITKGAKVKVLSIAAMSEETIVTNLPELHSVRERNESYPILSYIIEDKIERTRTAI